MDNNSASEESSSVSEGSQRFQEDEVVWAKIQGYPWWPAFIGDVEEAAACTLYRVYFFGDNSHSRLHPSKIRKFQEFFPDFAPQAKKNPRLKNALAIAQSQLTENHEDVSYFDIQSSERKVSNDKKIIQSGPQSSEEAKASGLELQPVKRKPGRPRKIKIVEPPLQQKIQVKNKTEITQLPSSKVEQTSQKVEIQEKQPVMQDLQQPNEPIVESPPSQYKVLHEIQQQVEEEVHSYQQSIPKKAVCKQIRKVKRLIDRSLFRQAFKVLSEFKMDRQNIIDILEMGIIPTLETKLRSRSLLKFKERVKKILVERYFCLSRQQPTLHTISQTSLRGKAIRRIFGLLKAHSPGYSKELAFAWQDSIRKRSLQRQQYMQQVVHLVSNAKIEGFLEGQLKEEGLS